MPPRIKKLVPAAVVLLLIGLWTLARPKPDLSLIGPDIKAYRVTYDGKGTPAAYLSVPFTRKDDARPVVNAAIDLNKDGKFAAYTTVGGAVQEEWIVRDARAKVIEAGNAFSFDLVDADVATRTNFDLVVVLTGKELKKWNGKPVAGSAMARVNVSKFVDEDFAPLYSASTAAPFSAGGLMDVPPGAPDPAGSPAQVDDRTKIKTAGNGPWLSDTTAGAGEGAAIGATPTPPVAPPAEGSDFEIFQPGVPDMTQGHNECVPTSISNGLTWLAERYGFKDKMPDTQLAAREELKGDLGWTSADGANMGNNVINAKVAFSRRHGIPVVTHRIGNYLDDDIVRKIAVELAKGQAVEVGVGYYTQNATSGAWTRHGGHMMSGVGAFGANGQAYLGVHDPLSPETGRLDMYEVRGSRIFDYRYRGNTMVFIEFAYAQSPTEAWVAEHPPQTALDARGFLETQNLAGSMFVDAIKIGTAWYPSKQFHTGTGPECAGAEHWHANIHTAWGLQYGDKSSVQFVPEAVRARHFPAVQWTDPDGCGAGKVGEVEHRNIMISKDEAYDLVSKIVQ
ncbi:MAG TPA: hypothetical protein VJ694_00560 [Patescibacteria group bacterium]|nr:hypothetical protein [Patescibacteria group bacterium]